MQLTLKNNNNNRRSIYKSFSLYLCSVSKCPLLSRACVLENSSFRNLSELKSFSLFQMPSVPLLQTSFLLQSSCYFHFHPDFYFHTMIKSYLILNFIPLSVSFSLLNIFFFDRLIQSVNLVGYCRHLEVLYSVMNNVS